MDILRDHLKAERGRLSELARALAVTPGAISQWHQVPPHHVLQIERKTGLSRHDLRPDIYGPAQQEAAKPKRRKRAA